MKKIGISCAQIVSRFGIERGLEICKKSGFDAVDFGLEDYHTKSSVYFGSLDEFESHFYAIKKKAIDLELEISQSHGLCRTYLPNDEKQREWVHIITEKDLHASAIIGSPSCVVHFINSTRWGKQPPEQMRRVSREMFDAIIPYAEKHKVNIALETFGAARIGGDRIRDFFASPEEFLAQYDRMNTKYKTICVDTGHTHEAESFWVPPPEEMIRQLGRDVSILHLHDNSGHWDDHLLPGMGSIDWPAVFDALDDIDYSGVYNFELRLAFGGEMLEEWLAFIGKFLKRFVNGHGKI